MKTLYFDCFAGASGDMILGALIDAGLSPASLRRELKKLDLPTVHVQVKEVLRGGLSATRVVVEGKGQSSVGETSFEWEENDIFVVPSWIPQRHRAESEAVLCSFSDRVAQEKLGLWREQRDKHAR